MGNVIFKNPWKKFPDFSNGKGKPFTKWAAKSRPDKASSILAQGTMTAPSAISVVASPAEVRSPRLLFLFPGPLITSRIKWESSIDHTKKYFY